VVKKKIKIIWDDEAKKSLRHIYSYIKGRESVEVASKVRDKIITQTKTLNDFPEKFEKEHNLDEEAGNYRYCVIWSYKIIYEVTAEAIYILDIFHTSRDPLNIQKLK
jgi:plasmid stabilization system protein ParE